MLLPKLLWTVLLKLLWRLIHYVSPSLGLICNKSKNKICSLYNKHIQVPFTPRVNSHFWRSEMLLQMIIIDSKWVTMVKTGTDNVWSIHLSIFEAINKHFTLPVVDHLTLWSWGGGISGHNNFALSTIYCSILSYGYTFLREWVQIVFVCFLALPPLKSNGLPPVLLKVKDCLLVINVFMCY